MLSEGCREALEMKAPCDWCDEPLTEDNIISIGREPSGPGGTIVHKTCWDQGEKRRPGDAFRDGWQPIPPSKLKEAI